MLPGTDPVAGMMEIAGVSPPEDAIGAVPVTDVILPPLGGSANVPSPRRNVVVLFGGVGTAPPTVAVIVGRSEFDAMLGTPVLVVFFSRPVASPARDVPLMPVTVKAVPPVASPVWVALVTFAVLAIIAFACPVVNAAVVSEIAVGTPVKSA
jgi:hypothetical protein